MQNNKTVKSLMTQLTADNSNQTEFLTSVRLVAAQLQGKSFLTKGRSRYRKATRLDLMLPPVKTEAKDSTEENKDTKKARHDIVR
jgi:hypothetical protein